ncbi:carbohydrate ABC transporter permease [Alkalibacterium sp. f15]|uniref:carbohydrate ABC transporter permease n=1 Tax=Alkalibacterium sp. f15 TaxID=3414029 RepID=UPI003BF8A2FD
MKKRYNWPATIMLMISSIFILFPLYITIVTAFKTRQELSGNLLALPSTWSFDNIIQAIQLTGFWGALTNSLVITIPTVIATVLVHSLVGYVIARNLHRKGFKILYYYIVSAMFVPFSILMLPLVTQTSSWGIDNRYGMILLYLVLNLAFNTFLYVGFVKTIPVELEEAAVMDGASEWKIFWQVIFPLMKPMNATVAILTTLGTWNDFMLPLVILGGRRHLATIPLTQYIFESQFSTNYTLAFSSYLLAMLPMLIIYIIAQKWVISGVTRGALK